MGNWRLATLLLVGASHRWAGIVNYWWDSPETGHLTEGIILDILGRYPQSFSPGSGLDSVPNRLQLSQAQPRGLRNAPVVYIAVVPSWSNAQLCPQSHFSDKQLKSTAHLERGHVELMLGQGPLWRDRGRVILTIPFTALTDPGVCSVLTD